MLFADEPALLDTCKQEINDLHEFFEAWLAGSLPETEGAISRLRTALAADFTMIGPDGKPRNRQTVIDWICDSHGRRPDLNIWIENALLRWSDDSTAIVTYEEWQKEAGSISARQSTAIFQNSSTAPNGVIWLHVHETWLDDPV